jgi:hypothetical protein
MPQIILSALLPLALGFGFYFAYLAGQRNAQKEEHEKRQSQSIAAKYVQDRLRHDDDFAKRVRDRFTR